MARKKKVNGQKQAEEIYEIYKTQMDDSHKEAFLLGRIATLLDLGNAFTSTCNECIQQSDAVLYDLRSKDVKEEPKNES